MRAVLLIRRVHGNSMFPALQPSQIVVASGWHGRLRKGDVVLLRHGGLEKIKRITDIRQGEFFVAGDNSAESTDSHDFGWVNYDSVTAKLIWPRT